MDYKETYVAFSTTFAHMQEQLAAWVQGRGGTIDEEGYVNGLTPNDLIHYDKRNGQLEAMLEYVEAVEADRKEKGAEIDRLRTRLKMLETAQKAEKYTDDYVLKEVNFLRLWEIVEDTTLDDFKGILKETIFFFDLALKRKIVEADERTLKKMQYSSAFLKNEEDLRYFFFNKKGKLKEAAKIPILDEHTQDLAQNARSNQL
jgi:hypothetical protein